MNIETLQEQIDNTEYWDMPILDVQIRYFGDEIYIYIENNDHTSWKISFISCFKVNYETDANWRGDFHVKDMKGPQLGYFGQDISIMRNQEDENFIDTKLDLSIMTMEITCRDIYVEQVENFRLSFFWKN
ncbi:hypothetical protein KK120_19440 [Virgibacillus dakarensis]|nr:hypothetical protein [Virgibacillus dakarensis]